MRAAEWLAACAGTTISIAMAVFTAESQVEAFGPGVSPREALWPLPGLALLDWVALGLLGFVAVALSNIHQAWIWNKVTWAVCGALLVLMIVGAFSIGPYVMLAALCFGIAAALAWAREKPHIAADALALGLGVFVNFLLLFVFILFGRMQG